MRVVRVFGLFVTFPVVSLLTATLHRLQPLVSHVFRAPFAAALVHNFTVHRSGTNTTSNPRRGFSANYVDARTRVLDPKPPLAGPIGVPGHTFPIVWPSPFAS